MHNIKQQGVLKTNKVIKRHGFLSFAVDSGYGCEYAHKHCVHCVYECVSA